MSTKIVLAEDHRLMRAGLRALLNEQPDVEVVAEASDGEEALRVIAKTQPDLVLLDISLPKLNGIEVATRLAKEHPRIRVIILSMHQDAVYVRQALRAGVAGYLVKGAEEAELDLALKAVLRGDQYLSPAVSRGLVEEVRHPTPAEASPFDRLTARQREFLQRLAEGQSTKEIAHHLNISVKTAEFHRAELMKRLDIHDVPGLVRYAIRHGLVQSET